MKNEYEEVRTLSAYSIRGLCIEKGWYTAGDNEAYNHMLFDLTAGKKHFTTEDIIAIAKDIYNHTRLDDLGGYDVEDVAFEVARKAMVLFKKR